VDQPLEPVERELTGADVARAGRLVDVAVDALEVAAVRRLEGGLQRDAALTGLQAREQIGEADLGDRRNALVAQLPTLLQLERKQPPKVGPEPTAFVLQAATASSPCTILTLRTTGGS